MHHAADMDEGARLAALHDLALLDTPCEPAFDDVVRLASAVTGCPIACISLVAAEHTWIKASVGTAFLQVPRDRSLCAQVVAAGRPLVMPDLRERPDMAHELAWLEGFRFYAGIPLRSAQGHTIGVLCVLDWRPRRLRRWRLMHLMALAKQAEAQLHLREQAVALTSARGGAIRVVEQVAHELRSPLTAVRGALGLLESENDQGQRLLAMAQLHTDRVIRLVDATVDLEALEARSLELIRELVCPCELVRSAALGVRTLADTRGVRLVVREAPVGPLLADGPRLVQALVFLFAHTVERSEPGGEVEVSVRESGSELQLDITDAGSPCADRGILEALGCALVRAHGARAEVHDGRLGGRRYRLTFPLS